MIVVEEFYRERNFLYWHSSMGGKIYPMPISQDHKRAYDEDRGPNTGGMGAYTPVPQIADELVEEAIQKILQPAADGMVRTGTSVRWYFVCWVDCNTNWAQSD